VRLLETDNTIIVRCTVSLSVYICSKICMSLKVKFFAAAAMHQTDFYGRIKNAVCESITEHYTRKM